MFFFSTVVLLITFISCEEYQLQFDWKLSTLSTDVDICTVTWNDATVATLKQQQLANRIHRSSVMVDFKQGLNQINFFYVGINGQVAIDNIMMTRPPKTINFIVNGDFQMQPLSGQSFTYSQKIPGWSAQKIVVVSNFKVNSDSAESQAVVLDSKHNEINQKISFGRINKYSFQSTFADDLKKKAKEIFANNLQKYSHLFLQNKQHNSFEHDPSQKMKGQTDGSSYFQGMADQQVLKSSTLKQNVFSALQSIKDYMVPSIEIPKDIKFD